MCGALLVAALGLITLDSHGGGPVARLRDAASALFGPAERIAATAARPVTGFFEAIADAPAAARKEQALELQDQRLRAELSAAQLAAATAAELDRLLQLAGRGGYRLVATRVIGVGAGYENTVTIDVGTRDGVRADQTVLNKDGLVGIVITAAPWTSTVLLALDASSAVGCRVEGSQQIGVVRGAGRAGPAAGPLRLQLLSTTAVPQPGQRLVTLGSVGGHPYVPGVPIGVITRVDATPGALTRAALVRPFVQFSALDVVGVVVVTPRRDPRDAVLPPPPPRSVARAAAHPARGPAVLPGQHHMRTRSHMFSPAAAQRGQAVAAPHATSPARAR